MSKLKQENGKGWQGLCKKIVGEVQPPAIMSTASRTTTATSHAASCSCSTYHGCAACKLLDSASVLDPGTAQCCRFSDSVSARPTRLCSGRLDSGSSEREQPWRCWHMFFTITALEVAKSGRLTWGTHIIVKCSSETVGLPAQPFSRVRTRVAAGDRAYELSSTSQHVSSISTHQNTHASQSSRSLRRSKFVTKPGQRTELEPSPIDSVYICLRACLSLQCSMPSLQITVSSL